jgi:hypothetical protein
MRGSANIVVGFTGVRESWDQRDGCGVMDLASQAGVAKQTQEKHHIMSPNAVAAKYVEKELLKL